MEAISGICIFFVFLKVLGPKHPPKHSTKQVGAETRWKPMLFSTNAFNSIQTSPNQDKFLSLGLSAFAFERKPGGSCGDVQAATSGSF